VSTQAASASRAVAGPVPSLVPVLALQEARRLLLHPLTLFGFAVFAFNAVLTVVGDHGPRSAFETINLVLTFYPGLMLVLAANPAWQSRPASTARTCVRFSRRPGGWSDDRACSCRSRPDVS
jgi:hypothetical protein